MTPSYEAFMRPLLAILPDAGSRSYAELAEHTAAALGLPSEAVGERVAWDGMSVPEARVRKAAHDLEMAGLVERHGDQVALSAAGRAERERLPSTLSVGVLTDRFPAYAAYRQAQLQRRGA